ncbi:hypothetical protein SDC9_209671 [bioreactor metagenome]|uniref:Uncharacterized protein n=1 Tax=bioreactor metagenome TaxID=1076179 RepID=A0A645JDX3_9ZZZZ
MHALEFEIGFVGQNISGIQEGVFIYADIHKRSLHPGQHILHSAFIDVAYKFLAAETFDINLYNFAVFKYDNARLVRVDFH